MLLAAPSIWKKVRIEAARKKTDAPPASLAAWCAKVWMASRTSRPAPGTTHRMTR